MTVTNQDLLPGEDIFDWSARRAIEETRKRQPGVAAAGAALAVYQQKVAAAEAAKQRLRQEIRDAAEAGGWGTQRLLCDELGWSPELVSRVVRRKPPQQTNAKDLTV